jgi:glycosyltransferase involved in cell wall biosynthesis
MTAGKKTIVHVIDSLGIGGAEVLLRTSLSVMPQYRHIVCYLTPPHDLAPSLEADKIYFLDLRRNFDFVKCALKLRKIITHEKAVLVHAHLLKSTWVSRWASWKKTPLLFTIHNVLSEDSFKINRLSYYLEKYSYKKGQSIISVSKGALVDYEKWIGVKGKTYILYNTIEECFFKAGENYQPVTDAATRLIAVGNLRRQKNYGALLKAFTFLKNEKVTLDIYGKGDLFDELQSYIEQQNLPVSLKGQVENISEILPGYHGFIMASSFEGYGIAPVEAMAVGLPLLLSDLDVLREITDNKALFFQQEEPEKIAEAIKKFIQMPAAEKMLMSHAGKMRAKVIGGKENFTSSLLSIYQAEIN